MDGVEKKIPDPPFNGPKFLILNFSGRPREFGVGLPKLNAVKAFSVS